MSWADRRHTSRSSSPINGVSAGGIASAWSSTGRTHFSADAASARGTLTAGAGALELRIDGTELDRWEDVMGRHLVRFATRDELISLLEEPAELEHGLCCSDLYAAFSLKTGDTSLTGAQADAIERWYRVIGNVAVQETLHLSLVAT